MMTMADAQENPLQLTDKPRSFDIQRFDLDASDFDHNYTRRLSEMEGYFVDEQAYEQTLAEGDLELYHVYEVQRPARPGELRHGLSIVRPGKIGDEYFMTKGHFHQELETGELYHCLQGQGCMVMETPQGRWAVEWLRPGRVLYVPPRWAHRSVNTGKDKDLITLFVYPGNAGHDYGAIEKSGFRKLILERGGEPRIVDNPRWVRDHEGS
jgi:glucose-6-phosphate isomerase